MKKKEGENIKSIFKRIERLEKFAAEQDVHNIEIDDGLKEIDAMTAETLELQKKTYEIRRNSITHTIFDITPLMLSGAALLISILCAVKLGL